MKHEPQIPGEYIPSLDKANDPFPMSIVIVYNDIRAALRATQTIERLGQKFNGQMRSRLKPVPFSQLRDPVCFAHLLNDAILSDMIIISLNGLDEIPPILKKWLADCLSQKRGGDAALVALLNSDGKLDTPDSPSYQFMKSAAIAAGLKFFAPKPEAEAETDALGEINVEGQMEIIG